jgi:hypothetical protein
MIIPKISSEGDWWLKKLHAQSVKSPFPPHSLIFEIFGKSAAVPDMTPKPVSR